jgi:hypothetical protein
VRASLEPIVAPSRQPALARHSILSFGVRQVAPIAGAARPASRAVLGQRVRVLTSTSPSWTYGSSQLMYAVDSATLPFAIR